jgi:hypothetical protein
MIMLANLKEISLMLMIVVIISLCMIIKYKSDKEDACNAKIVTYNTYTEMLKKQSDEVVMKRQELEKEAAAVLEHAKLEHRSMAIQQWPVECHAAAQMALSIALKDKGQ